MKKIYELIYRKKKTLLNHCRTDSVRSVNGTLVVNVYRRRGISRKETHSADTASDGCRGINKVRNFDKSADTGHAPPWELPITLAVR